MFVLVCRWPSYLIGAGSLVDPARVLVVLLGLGLVRHAVGLVHWRHVVHQGDGLHRLVNSAADGLADLGGCRSSGGWKVVGGLERSAGGPVNALKTSFTSSEAEKSDNGGLQV